MLFYLIQSRVTILIRPFLEIVKRDDFVEKMNMVSIFGSVHFPGKYPYTDGMSLADAIKAAGGPKNRTYESEVEITSLTNQDKKYSSTNKFSSIDFSYGFTTTCGLKPMIFSINSVLNPFMTDITIIKTATPRLMPMKEKM